MKIALTIQYDGNNFFGFQRQINFRSVQEDLENVLKVYFRKPVIVYCAGRTDTGVHSEGQVIHFEIDENDLYFRTRSIARMIYNLNCILPKDVSIVYGKIVPDDFHARFSCLSREYVYGIITSQYRMSIYQKNHLWIRYPVDLEVMRIAAGYLIGEHDFAAFTKSIYTVKNEKTIRRIDKIEIIRKESFLFFYYHGSGFLHNMVRIITGTLLLAGRGSISPITVQNILHGKNRTAAGNTLPAFPLVFLNARYAEYETPRQLIPHYQLLGL